ncbi:MAG: hypothetical protein ACJ76P_09620 [Actinomycetota bacterium]
MTRYLCGHPSHGAPDAPGPVDVTPQVRLERQFPPRALVCLAFTEDVLGSVRALREEDPVERTRSVLRVLTGDPSPHDGPVVLVADARVERAPGMYQIDDVRTAEPIVGELLARYVDPEPEAARATDEVVVLGEPAPYETYGTSTERVGTATPIEQETRTLPQGVFSVIELAQRLAAASTDEVSLVEAIRRTAPYAAPMDLAAGPWRVIVECPDVPADDIAHLVLFTGTGEHEPPIVYGTLPSTRDAMVEEDAATDLDPARQAARAERRLLYVLLGTAATTIGLALVGWLSGALSFLIRDAAFWLGLSIVLLAASLVVGGWGLLQPTTVRGNLDDVYDVRAVYQRRLELQWWTTASTGGLAVAALLVVLLAGLIASSATPPPAPTPRISFSTAGSPTIAHVAFTARNVGRSDHVIVDARTFASGNDRHGVAIGRVTTTGSSSGLARVDDSLAVNGDAAFLAVRVWFAGHHVPVCNPAAASGSGCTIVTVPQRGTASAAVTLGATATNATTVTTPGTTTSPAATAPSTGASPSAGATTPSTTASAATQAPASFSPPAGVAPTP